MEKKLSKIKLNQLSKSELEQREMNLLLGGDESGGSSGSPCDCSIWIPSSNYWNYHTSQGSLSEGKKPTE